MQLETQLETHFSGELALTAGKGKGAPSTPAASAAVYVPRGDSGTRGLVDDPAHAQALADMRTRLERWIEETGALGRFPESDAALRAALKRWGDKAVNVEYDRVR